MNTTTTTKHPRIRVHHRWMIARDMPAILAIEAASFTDPWDEAEFKNALKQRNVIASVCEIGDEVIGFKVYELRRGRIHLTTLAVHPNYRRCGVGEQMIQHLTGKLESHRRKQLTVDVRETNVPAQLWLRSCGLLCEKVTRHGYGTGEDSYRFVWRVDDMEVER